MTPINSLLNIRQADIKDIPAITALFYDTINTINSKDYTKEEIADWSSWHTDTKKWTERVNEQYFIIALRNNTIVGFSSLAPDGYLDFMFVHKDFQHQGIATLLLQKIEDKAKELNLFSIYSEVSITAKDFFEKNGFIVEIEQRKRSRNLELVNFKMRKQF